MLPGGCHSKFPLTPTQNSEHSLFYNLSRTEEAVWNSGLVVNYDIHFPKQVYWEVDATVTTLALVHVTAVKDIDNPRDFQIHKDCALCVGWEMLSNTYIKTILAVRDIGTYSPAMLENTRWRKIKFVTKYFAFFQLPFQDLLYFSQIIETDVSIILTRTNFYFIVSC